MGLSAVIVRLFQFAKEAFCRKVIGVCSLLPEGEMSVVVQFVLLLPKGFHIARYLRFLEHLVHPFGEVAFLLTFPYHVERIFHHAPDNIPLLLRLDIGLDPKSQYLLQLIRIDPIYKKRVSMSLVFVSIANHLGQHLVLSLVFEELLEVFFCKCVAAQFVGERLGLFYAQAVAVRPELADFEDVVVVHRLVQQNLQNVHVGFCLSVEQIMMVLLLHPCEVSVLSGFLKLLLEEAVDDGLLGRATNLPRATQIRDPHLYLLGNADHKPHALRHPLHGQAFEALVVGGHHAGLLLWAACSHNLLKDGGRAGLGKVHEVSLNLLPHGHNLTKRGFQLILPHLLQLFVVDVINGDVGLAAKVLDQLAVCVQARTENLSDVEYILEGRPSVAYVAIDLVDDPLRLLAHVNGLRLKAPKVFGGEWTVKFLTCARVEREQVFFQGDFHVARSGHFFLHGC